MALKYFYFFKIEKVVNSFFPGFLKTFVLGTIQFKISTRANIFLKLEL